MKKTLFLLSSIFMSVPLTSAVLAQSAFQNNNQLEQDDLQKDEIIVTGTRFATPIDQVGRSVSVVDASEIEIRQQRFLFDVLTTQPGVQVNRSGSFGSLATVSVRGLPSGQTLVVQDGIVLNNPSSFDNGFNFANFDSADIERVEVLRGAQSVLYGSDAIGGVINIVTKGANKEGIGGNAFIEGGTFGTFRGAGSIVGGNDFASGRLSISGITSQGFSSADAANGNIENDGFNNITFSTKGQIRPTEKIDLTVIARYQDSENEFDGFAFGVGPVDGDEVGETEEFSIAGIATYTALNGTLSNRLSVSYLLNDQVTFTDGAASFDALGTRISYEYQGTFKPLEELSIIGGAEYDEQESRVDIGFGGNQEIETVSGFALLQFQPVSFVTLNGGVRHDAATGFDNETTFNVSTAIRVPQTNTLIRASYAEGFRAPSAGELSFNPALFAEFSDGFDIGVEQYFFEDRLKLGVIYFDQQIDDLIAFDLEAFTFVNIQEFSATGVEVTLDAILSPQVTFSASYTFTDALNISTVTPAGNQPRNRVSAEFVLTPTEKLSLSIGALYNGEEFSGGNILNDFFLVNLRTSYALTDQLEIFGRIENLTDANYQDNFGFGTAPLSGFGGVRVKF